MDKPDVVFMSESDDSSEEGGDSIIDEHCSTRASTSNYVGTNPLGLNDCMNLTSFSDYEPNRSSFGSDYDGNRFSFTSENNKPLSDQESTKECSENPLLSQLHSEEDSKQLSQQQTLPETNGRVTFHKHGQPTKMFYKPITCPHKRSLSGFDNEEEEMPAKRSKFDNLAKPTKPDTHYDDKAKTMMERMGYRKGEGLGKHSQGRVNPVEASKQRGRRGLGHTLPGLEPAELTWDATLEVVSVEEKCTWLKNNFKQPLDKDTLQSWQQIGPRNHNIEEFTDFCDSNILSNVLSKKSIFDSLDADEMRKARTRSNPFETIGKGMFLNRAAMKMANLDRVYDFMFTDPNHINGVSMLTNDRLLYFADVCAGPGGFSEYVLWRKKWRAKGFGFTLKGDNDFKLSDFISGPCESFEPYYGKKSDGNVFDPENIESFMHFVMDSTVQQGVHFMMADGGFSVDGQENIQELLSKQLYLCQFLVALCIVRNGGHFVCKLFDIFSPFSVGLVYLMYRAFDCISIHKPNSSRPANSERYIICKWKRSDCEPTRQYLFNLNKELCNLDSNSDEDLTHCVSMEELFSDKTFYDYIVESNNILGERQVINLVKIAAFCRDVNLREEKQAEMRRGCLAYWKVPDMARKVDKTTPDEIASKRLHKCDPDVLFKSTGLQLKTEEHLNTIKSIYDWLAIPLGTEKDYHFFIGLGRNQVYRLSQGGTYWKKADVSKNSNLELSPGTMVYGELVNEFKGQGKTQSKNLTFHIIDAISLGEEVITHLHYTERLRLCRRFAESLKKTHTPNHCQIKVKIVYELPGFTDFFRSLDTCDMRNGTNELLLVTDIMSFKPKGVMFVNATREPWMRHFSRTRKMCYYDNRNSPSNSKYDQDRPVEACASTFDCILRRLIWAWEVGVGVHNEPPQDNVLHRDQLLKFVHQRTSR